jgi:hypothetical protein
MTRLSRALTDFTEGRWNVRDTDPRREPRMDSHEMEPPLHPSELDRFEGGRWRLARWIPVPFVRFLLVFFIGVGTTLAWQSYGNAARRMVANLSPALGWLAPPLASAALPAAPGSASAAPAAASPEHIAALSRSLAAARQSLDKLAADIGKLQAAKQDPQGRTSAVPVSLPPPATAGASGRRATAQVQPTQTR